MTHRPGLVAVGGAVWLASCLPERRCGAHCGSGRELALELSEGVPAFGPACELSAGPVTVDLAAGCVAGVCVGAEPGVLEQERGPPELCVADAGAAAASPSGADTGGRSLERVGWCGWAADDVWVHGILDSRTGALAASLPVDAVAAGPSHGGATESGLGVGQSVTCSLEQLGSPSAAYWEPTWSETGQYQVRWLRYDGVGIAFVAVSDALPPPLSGAEFSRVQSLILFAPWAGPGL